jgi:cell division transport system ATP-binding protein
MAAPIIALSQVSKRYPGGGEALRGIDLSIDPGEMVFITGHSGAGKSTLLKLIAAIERPSSGTVLVGGQNVGSLGARAVPYLRRKLGLVFQDQKLLYDRSVFDNVMLPLVVTGQATRDAARRARAALDKVGLLAREKAHPLALSGGEQQRLCVARAVVNRPAILIADEPTSNLDAESAREVLEIFRSFREVGVTVLAATHDETAAGAMGARLVSLRRGGLS